MKTFSHNQTLITTAPDLAMTLHNLASLFAALGRPAEARSLYRHALTIFERALGPEHPHVLVCRQACQTL